MKMQYRPEIDGLRTIAVLSVIIYHAEFTLGTRHFVKGGFFGVDIFFVISGFLITSLIISEYHKTKNFSIIEFYERRTRRLLPALLVIILVSLPFAWKILFPMQLVDFSQSLISSLLFVSNFYWYETLREYGTESALLKPFLHTWSLAVEEQYYIIFPLILIAIYRWCKKYTIYILSVGCLLSLQFAVWATSGEYTSLSFYMLPSRLWELIAGGVLAHILLLQPQKKNITLLHRIMPATGLFLILNSLFFIGFDSEHPGFITLIPVLGTILIIWFANNKDVVTKFLSSKVLVGVGLISYSLYLWHYPIFAFGRIKNFNPSAYVKLEWILLTFILSIATYFLIEKPFRNRQVISLKMMFISLFSAITIVGCFSLYTIKNNGVKERLPQLIEIYGKKEFDNEILKKTSWAAVRQLAKSHGMDGPFAHKASTFEAKHLWFSDSSNTMKILIVGNSHSVDIFSALYQNKEYFPNLEFARFGLGDSLMSGQISELLVSPNFKAADVVITSFQYTKHTLKGISSFIDTVKNKSKEIIIASNTTEFNNIEGKPVYDAYLEKHHKDFSSEKLKKIFFESRNHRYRRINKSLIKIAKNKDIVFLNKDEFICDMELEICDGITDEGYKSFYDYGHYTIKGAKYFGHRIYKINWLKLE